MVGRLHQGCPDNRGTLLRMKKPFANLFFAKDRFAVARNRYSPAPLRSALFPKVPFGGSEVVKQLMRSLLISIGQVFTDPLTCFPRGAIVLQVNILIFDRAPDEREK